MPGAHEALLGGRTREEPALEPARYYVLGLFFVLMANQCLFWFTFSADPDTFKAYYPGLTTPAIDQLLNWGPITFVPTVPFVSWLLMQKNGLQKCMRLNACLCFTACAVRCIPCLFSRDTRQRHQWLLLLLHAAQMLNGIAGPVLIAAPSRLSALWFPPHQRTTVTAVANASFVGAAIGFFLCPAVLNDNPDNVPHLLLITLALASAPLLATLMYCPDHPAVQVSLAVEVVPSKTSGALGPRAFVVETFRVGCGNAQLLILMMVTALSIGIYDGWTGLLPQILTSELPSFDGGSGDGSAGTATGADWTANEAGMCGMVQTLSCIAGQIVFGQIADRCFARRSKILMVLLGTAATASLGWASTMFENPYVPWEPTALMRDQRWRLWVAISVAGACRTGLIPLLYEVAAELTYPVPEGTSAGLIVIAEHASLIVTLFAAQRVSLAAITCACWLGLACSTLLLLLVRPKYKRADAEATANARTVVAVQ
eukprot:COSAG03_NODE_567_length_6916_cov_2692.956286_4_plen_485_part_00